MFYSVPLCCRLSFKPHGPARHHHLPHRLPPDHPGLHGSAGAGAALSAALLLQVGIRLSVSQLRSWSSQSQCSTFLFQPSVSFELATQRIVIPMPIQFNAFQQGHFGTTF
jgi:hypothetical protein